MIQHTVFEALRTTSWSEAISITLVSRIVKSLKCARRVINQKILQSNLKEVSENPNPNAMQRRRLQKRNHNSLHSLIQLDQPRPKLGGSRNPINRRQIT